MNEIEKAKRTQQQADKLFLPLKMLQAIEEKIIALEWDNNPFESVAVFDQMERLEVCVGHGTERMIKIRHILVEELREQAKFYKQEINHILDND